STSYHSSSTSSSSGFHKAGPASAYGDVGSGGAGHGLLGGVHLDGSDGQGGLSAASLDSPGQSGLSAAPAVRSGLDAAPAAEAQGGGGTGTPPVGDYHTRVDVQGDGRWDAHTYTARPDGGIDINVDLNHDGQADFVGVDHDRDGLIDESY